MWFRDAEAAEAVDAILFIGLLPGWYPPNYDCGACGYATCAEFLHHTNTSRSRSAELEFTGRSATCATSTSASRSGIAGGDRRVDRRPNGEGAAP